MWEPIKLHSLGAYAFLGGMGSTSVVWGVFFVRIFKDAESHMFGLGVFSLCWSIWQLLMCGVFVAVKLVLKRDYRIKEAWSPGIIFRQRTNLDLELSQFASESLISRKRIDEMIAITPIERRNLDVIDEKMGSADSFSISGGGGQDPVEDLIGTQQMKYRYVATKLRYFSFVLEGLIGSSAIMLVTMNTIIRMYVDDHDTDFGDV